MKVNFNTQLKSLDGRAIKLREDSDEPLTLKVVAIEALNRPLAEDQQKPGLSYSLYTLSYRIVNAEGGELDIEAYDVELLKSRIEKMGSPAFLVGAAWDALEGREGPK